MQFAYGLIGMNVFFLAESYRDKIAAAFDFPNKSRAGVIWSYHSSDTFILTTAMNNYLKSQAGNDADIFDMARDEVYIPLHLGAGALTTLRTDNSAGGVPFGGYGLFWTQDDIAKVAALLNNNGGVIDGAQVLQPDMLADAWQKNPGDRGVDTTGVIRFKYNNAFWAKEFTPREFPQYPCSFWVIFQPGYGGIEVAAMPNGSIYYYFSDNAEFIWYYAVHESDKLVPQCR